MAAHKSEGELWAEELLAELKRGRFSATAWRWFLKESLARARQYRRTCVRAHRQVLALAGGALAVAVGVAASGRPLLAIVAGAWWGLVLLMTDWHLGMLERPDGTRLAGLGIANTITLLRGGAIPLLPILGATAFALAVLAAGVSDIADGLLARSREEATRLGAWLDSSVDGLLRSVAAVAAAERGLLPVWVAALIVTWYLASWAAIAGVYFTTARAPRRQGHAGTRAPGAVLVLGLTLAVFAVPEAAFVAAAGALAGLASLAATIVQGISRSRQERGRAGTAVPPPAAPRWSPRGKDGSSASVGPRSSGSASRARTLG
jgi:cardiolipin synthase